jgi:two-component system response regulator NreC
MRVLIVNSEWVFRRFIRSALETQGDLTVIGEAANGDEALRLSKQLKPDVILTDMDLLDGHSLDTTRQIRAQLPGTRIIMFSALDGEAYHHAATRCGADAFVSKGAPISGILGLIRQGKVAEAAD